MTTITIKDLVANSKRKHANPIMGVGSKAAVNAFANHADNVRDRDTYVAFGQSILAALKERLAGYVSVGKTDRSAQVKMTSSAIHDLDLFLATYVRVQAIPVVATQPVAPEAPAKPVSRMTKAELVAMVEFLSARV